MATTRPTTAVSSSSSGKLRSQIGRTKRRISEHLLEKVPGTDSINGYNAEDTYDFLLDLGDTMGNLLTQSRKLQQLDQKWTNLINQNPSEKEIQKQYIDTYDASRRRLHRRCHINSNTNHLTTN
ncbi:Protein CBG16877 [Caenorhabditis briggsae]|uniref:Protein CBG16877 n=1 Tax=Caenorhabditis briggsae TaxID=6238 RepID=A8XPZ7_CAEBR|nr:Protein CBG16877 [Caenorhabditis briggsae]CAP34723.1 Protein CBG16877 [Caenorhabditis briggsae]